MNNSENKQIYEHELYDYMRSEKIICAVAYEHDIDPLQYFVFAGTESDKLRIEKFIDDRKLSGPYSSGRIIRVVNLVEVISHRWFDEIVMRSDIREGIRIMKHDDFMILALLWIVTQYKTECFIRKNIKQSFGDDLTERELRLILLDYMRENGFGFSAAGLRSYMHKLLVNIKLSLVHRFLPLFVCAKKFITGFFCGHENSVGVTKRFTAFIDNKFNLSGNYKLLGESSYIFIDANINGEEVFIKGTESSERICFFENEIEAQKKLFSLSDESKNLFICMKDFCYENMKYIIYPFVNGLNIEEYYDQGKRFNSSELQEFGEFLLDVLDVLHENGIVHRDLRPANIMLIPSDRFKFRLTDFGCAYSGGMNRLSFDDKTDKIYKGWAGVDFRYFDGIADDAASAYLTYIFCGGDMNDDYALRMKSLVGRSYIS